MNDKPGCLSFGFGGNPIAKQQKEVDKWTAKNKEATEKFCEANTQRFLAVNGGKTAEAKYWEEQYSIWFNLHSEYFNKQVEADAKLRELKESMGMQINWKIAVVMNSY